MKLLSKLLVIASAFAAGSALAKANDQSDFFTMQREVSDGYYATHPATQPAPTNHETSRHAQAS